MLSNQEDNSYIAPTQSDVKTLLTYLLHSAESQAPAKACCSLTGEPRSPSSHRALITSTTDHQPVTTDSDSPPPSSNNNDRPVSHVLLAPSITPNLLHALNHPPSTAPPDSAPIAFLLRPPPSLHASLSNPHTLLLSDQTAVASHLHLNFNVPLAAELGIDTTAALPLYDPFPHRQGKTIGLVGSIADVEGAAKYRFQTKQLEDRLRQMVGRHAPLVNRVSDVFRLCIGVSEEGAIGVFDYASEASSRNGHSDAILEEEEEEEDDEASDTIGTASPANAATTITALAFSRSFDAHTVDKVHLLAQSAGFLPTPNSRMLFITPQPRQSGLAAAKARNMLVMCVTNIAANLWALRYLSRRIKEHWPELEVKMVPK